MAPLERPRFSGLVFTISGNDVTLGGAFPQNKNEGRKEGGRIGLGWVADFVGLIKRFWLRVTQEYSQLKRVDS